MKTKLMIGTAVSLFLGGAAVAQDFNDRIVADLQSKGFDRIEIKTGPRQTKVEAINGARKVEVVYDNSTGRILEQEWESAAGEDIDLGVDIKREDEDFVRVAGYDDDDDDYDRDDDDDDDDRDDDDRDDDDGDDDDDDRDDDDDDDDRDDDDDDDGDDDDDDRGRDGDDDEDDDADDDGDDDDDDDDDSDDDDEDDDD